MFGLAEEEKNIQITKWSFIRNGNAIHCHCNALRGAHTKTLSIIIREIKVSISDVSHTRTHNTHTQHSSNESIEM